jgi:hypothetical protein
MKPRQPTEADIEFWGGNCTIGPMQGDHVGAESIEVLKEIVSGVTVIRVPWVMDDRDRIDRGIMPMADLTIWTTFWGGMLPTDVVLQ